MEAAEVTSRKDLESSPLAELYRREADSGRNLAFLLTGDWVSADDLVQEAFVRLAGRLAHVRKRGSFHSYLRRTIVNLHISGLRRLRLEREWLRSEAASQLRTSSLPDAAASDELVTALGILPKRQRAAVVLRYCLDLSEAQVAETMKCSLAAARGLISRGIRTLRAELGGGTDG
jgi:RNA polymerase sigma-70 factor (sigma-E family)